MASTVQRSVVDQFARFAAVGGVGTLAHYTVLWFGVRQLGVSPTFASAAGALVGALVNYVLNYHFTFASDKPHLEAAGKFFAVAGVGLVLNTLLMHALTTWLAWYYLFAQCMTTGVLLMGNFAINRLWIFAQGGAIRKIQAGRRMQDE